MQTKTIQLSLSKARELYSGASPEFKTMLEENFSKKELIQDVMDRVQSYEDACAELGLEPMNEAQMLRAGFRQDEIDRRKLETITEAWNEGEVMDWNDHGQEKHYPWFNFSGPSGFAFYDTRYSCSSARAGLASRLCFHTREKAKRAGEIFLDLYKSVIDNSPRA